MVKRGLAVLTPLLLAQSAGVAQDLPKMQMMPSAVFDIPFKFFADGDLMPAGTYEFRPNAAGTHIELRNTKGAEITLVNVMTSLSAANLAEAELGFDVVGQDHYLSEFYLPGMDGFAFDGAPGKHEHQKLLSQKRTIGNRF